MSSAEWEKQLEFVATVISKLPTTASDDHRVAVAIFSDKGDYTTIFDYNDYDFRSVLSHILTIAFAGHIYSFAVF